MREQNKSRVLCGKCGKSDHPTGVCEFLKKVKFEAAPEERVYTIGTWGVGTEDLELSEENDQDCVHSVESDSNKHGNQYFDPNIKPPPVKTQPITARIRVGKHFVKAIMDTGANVSVASVSFVNLAYPNWQSELHPYQGGKLTSASNNEMAVKGWCRIPCKIRELKTFI